ncbi:MAG TPA: TonB family protein, partial [Polyangia bacterium]|nr:TonB family protein [Polyangia bacterium]
MEPCLALRPADAPVNLLRPCCAHVRRARWLVSRAIVVQLATCAICAAAPSVRADPAPAKVAQAEVLTPPNVIHGVKAEYPPEAATSGREADVVVLATVSVSGDVTAVEVAEHGGDPFDDVAVAAARQ